MKIKRERTKLEKRAARGFQGYPVATVAFYGPDETRATKVSVGIAITEDAAPHMSRWRSDITDVRYDQRIASEILAHVKLHNVKTIVMNPVLMGCPHEEGVDYPKGQHCPQCTYWAGRDRFSGMRIS